MDEAVGDSSRDEPLHLRRISRLRVPSPASGVLTEIIVPEGAPSTWCSPRCHLGERRRRSARRCPGRTAPRPQARTAGCTAPPPHPVAPPPAPAPAPVASAPPPRRRASHLPGTVSRPAGPDTSRPPVPLGGGGEKDSRVLSPVVRRLLPTQHRPGERHRYWHGGRITREDVLAVVDARHGATRRRHLSSSRPRADADRCTTGRCTCACTRRPPHRRSRSLSRWHGADHHCRGTTGWCPSRTCADARPSTWCARSDVTARFHRHRGDFENIEQVRRTLGARFKAEEGSRSPTLPFICRPPSRRARLPNLNASVADDALVSPADQPRMRCRPRHEGLIVPRDPPCRGDHPPGMPQDP